MLQNFSVYGNETAWFKTGPGLLSTSTSKLLAGLYAQGRLSEAGIWVMSQQQLRNYVFQHLPLSYKNSENWFTEAYRKKIVLNLNPEE